MSVRDTVAQPTISEIDHELPASVEATPSRRPALRRLSVPGTGLAILVMFLSAWQLGTEVRIGASDRPLVDPFLWSSPLAVAARTWKWTLDGTIAKNFYITLFEALAGLGIGMIIGVTAGFLLGRSNFWASVFRPFIHVINATPGVIFAPLLFMIFGLGVESKIAVVVLSVFFIMFFNAFQGVRDVDISVQNNARMLGASRFSMVRHVLLPSVMVWIFSSLHIAIGSAMASAVVGEYLGSTRGLGYLVGRHQELFDTTGVLAGIVVMSVCVTLVVLIVVKLEKRLVKWKPQSKH